MALPRPLKTQKEWQSLQDAGRGVRDEGYKEKYGLKNEKLDAMLDAIIAEIPLGSGNRPCQFGTPPADRPSVSPKDRNAFTNAVLEHIVALFVGSGDGDRLVSLLSVRFATPPATTRPSSGISLFSERN